MDPDCSERESRNPKNKNPGPTDRGFCFLEPGDDLLSHGETPHYHRRCIVSLLSSGWSQVVPMLYGRQANWLGTAVGLTRSGDAGLPNKAVDQAEPPDRSRGLSRQADRGLLTLSFSALHTGLATTPGSLAGFGELPHPSANNLDYMVKPHGQLVLVSSTPYNASTPSLSTSSSRTALQDPQGVRENLSWERLPA